MHYMKTKSTTNTRQLQQSDTTTDKRIALISNSSPQKHKLMQKYFYKKKIIITLESIHYGHRWYTNHRSLQPYEHTSQNTQPKFNGAQPLDLEAAAGTTMHPQLQLCSANLSPKQ